MTSAFTVVTAQNTEPPSITSLERPFGLGVRSPAGPHGLVGYLRLS